MGSRSSKRRSTPVESLDEQTIEELCQDTGFTEEELQAWHKFVDMISMDQSKRFYTFFLL